MLDNAKILARFFSALAEIVRDPQATDKVVDVAMDISQEAQVFGAPEFLDDPRLEGRGHHMPEQHIDLEALGALPEGTLGRAYADYMRAHGFTVESLNRGGHDFEFSHMLVHLSTSHDIWHVLTNFNPEPAGEAGLQAFGLAQFDKRFAPVILAAVLLNGLLYQPSDLPRRVQAIRAGREMGARARWLIGVDWSGYWARPLDEVRAEFGLAPVQADSGFALAA